MRVFGWVAVVAVAVGSLVAAAAPGDNRPTDPAARAQQLARELRCPVCQGLSVADSTSSTARDIRADLRRRVDAGENDAEVLQAYVDRYGEWILLRPATRGLEALTWGVPAGAFAAVVVGLAFAFRRWRRQRGATPSPADRSLVLAARAARSEQL